MICSWCKTDSEESALHYEGPHTTWCPHFREEQCRGGFRQYLPPSIQSDWPFSPDRLTLTSDHCKCGAAIAHVTEDVWKLTACSSVLMGTAEGGPDAHNTRESTLKLWLWAADSQ